MCELARKENVCLYMYIFLFCYKLRGWDTFRNALFEVHGGFAVFGMTSDFQWHGMLKPHLTRVLVSSFKV